MRLLMKKNFMNTGFNHFFDRRLVEIYGADECEKLNRENPDFLNYCQFELENGFYIADIKSLDKLEDENKIEILESLDPVNFPSDEEDLILLGAFNPMRYNVKRSYFVNKYYQIGRTDKILVLVAGEDLRNKYNERKKAS